MNEEEKKAIGLLKALNNTEEKCKIEEIPYNSEIKRIKISLLPKDYGVFRTLLNLIEKLQKENEELKYKYDKALSDVVKETKKEEQLQKENEKLKNKILDIFEGKKVIEEETSQYIKENYISVQRVKDKIEELKTQYKIAIDENSTKAFILKCQITILQELLEGRK